MKSKFWCAAFLLLLFVNVSKAQFVKKHGQLSVFGTQLVDKDNNPIVLRGLSFGWHSMWPRFYNEKAVSWLKKDFNCNVVRAATGIQTLADLLIRNFSDNQEGLPFSYSSLAISCASGYITQFNPGNICVLTAMVPIGDAMLYNLTHSPPKKITDVAVEAGIACAISSSLHLVFSSAAVQNKVHQALKWAIIKKSLIKTQITYLQRQAIARMMINSEDFISNNLLAEIINATTDDISLAMQKLDQLNIAGNTVVKQGDNIVLINTSNEIIAKFENGTWKNIAKEEVDAVANKAGGLTEWATLERKLTSKLSSSIESSTLNKMITQMKNAGEEGFRLASRIEKGTYEGVEGYTKLIKNASVDEHSLKAVNQALDKADDLVAGGTNKSLLRFEDNPLGYDIDLGIRGSVGSSTYSEVYQFKTNTAPLTKGSIADASKQLYTAPANKRIVEFKLSEGDNISAIKNNESIKAELKFQLYDKGLKPSNNVTIDEFHLISSNGERARVVFQNGNLQFINF
jgi:hypothetical protein